MKDFFYEYDHDFDEVIDEVPGSNSFIALRKIRWSPEDEFRLDLRKYFTKADGTESVGKGISLLTESGADKLVETLIDKGYGNTNAITHSLIAREDGGVFDALVNIYNFDDKSQDERFKSNIDMALKRWKELNSNRVSPKEMLDDILRR